MTLLLTTDPGSLAFNEPCDGASAGAEPVGALAPMAWSLGIGAPASAAMQRHRIDAIPSQAQT